MKKYLLIFFACFLAFMAASCNNDTPKQPEETVKVSIWDGKTVDIAWYSEEKTEFILNEASELAGLAKLVNDGTSFEGKTIKLDSNIDLDSNSWTPIGLYKTEEDVDIKKAFSGSFDGNGHTISGLKINSTTGKSSYRALFGYADGKISNFTVKGEVSGCDVASVVAALDKGGIVDNVISYVSVSNTAQDSTQAKTGGIVLTIKDKNGKDAGWTISNCKNYGTVSSASSNDSVGGIFGWTADQTGKLEIKNCDNYGNVSAAGGNQSVGGIVGSCRLISIDSCTNSGSVSSANGAAGGIVGSNDTCDLKIKNCVNSGSVTGASNKAGAIGGAIRGDLTDCTATGALPIVGTLGAGSNDNSISYSSEKAVIAPSVVKGSLSLKNVKASSLSLAYAGKSKADLTVALNSSSIESMTVTMEQNENKSRLFLTKEGTSSIASLKFKGSFDRQNINTHGELYLFGNEAVAKENVSNELIYINRDSASTDKDYGNASIYWNATGTSASHTDSETDKIESSMTYNSTSDKWETKTT